MESGLISGFRKQPYRAQQGEVGGNPARVVIRPEHKDDGAVTVVSPSDDWGITSPYGSGQAFAVFNATDKLASDPSTDDFSHRRVIFRIDAQGGFGFAGGMHVATGRNQGRRGTVGVYGTGHMWIDGQYTDSTGLIYTGHASATKGALQVQNSTGQDCADFDSSQQMLLKAPDGIARAFGTLSNSGALAASFAASDSGSFGGRMVLNCVTPATIGLALTGATSQTADIQRWANQSGTLLKTDSAGNLVQLASDGVGRSIGTLSNSGSLAAAIAASDGGFSGGRLIANSMVPTTIGASIGAAASQTANMQVWLNSTGAVLSAADSLGGHWVGSPDAAARNIQVYDGAGNSAAQLIAGPGSLGTRALIVARGAALSPLMLQMSASPTADAQEWQSSTAAVLAKIDPSGNAILNTPGFLRVMDTGAHEAVSISGGSGGTGNVRVLSFADQSGNTNRIPFGSVAAAGQVSDVLVLFASTFGTLFSMTAAGQIKPSAANQATGGGSAALGANCPAVTATAPYTWQKMTAADGSQCYVPMWK